MLDWESPPKILAGFWILLPLPLRRGWEAFFFFSVLDPMKVSPLDGAPERAPLTPCGGFPAFSSALPPKIQEEIAAVLAGKAAEARG